jgi:hypothetical protein
MNYENKDLLILPKQHLFSEGELKKEVESICKILYSERGEADFFNSNELLDLNNYKSYRKPALIKKYLIKTKTAFVFLLNKN